MNRRVGGERATLRGREKDSRKKERETQRCRENRETAGKTEVGSGAKAQSTVIGIIPQDVGATSVLVGVGHRPAASQVRGKRRATHEQGWWIFCRLLPCSLHAAVGACLQEGP